MLCVYFILATSSKVRQTFQILKSWDVKERGLMSSVSPPVSVIVINSIPVTVDHHVGLDKLQLLQLSSHTGIVLLLPQAGKKGMPC